LTLHFFSFILVYGSLQLMYKHGNDKTVCWFYIVLLEVEASEW
jgi:hypothetical protein